MRARLYFVAFVVLAAIAGCLSLPEPVLCGEIPEGGCPIGRGGSCDDTSCAALYDCVDGRWIRAEGCARDAGVDADASADVDAGADADGGACTPVTIDTSGGGFDCTPDLQDPDCPAVAALPCAETACTTGCVDFYVCTTTGWIAVAYCTDDGQLVVDP